MWLRGSEVVCLAEDLINSGHQDWDSDVLAPWPHLFLYYGTFMREWAP